MGEENKDRMEDLGKPLIDDKNHSRKKSIRHEGGFLEDNTKDGEEIIKKRMGSDLFK